MSPPLSARPRLAPLILAALVAVPPLAPVAAQDDDALAPELAPTQTTLRFWPLAAGAAFGGLLAMGTVNPSGASPIGDEAVFALGLSGGVFAGILSQHPGYEAGFSLGYGGIMLGPLPDRMAESGERRQDMGHGAWEYRLSILRHRSGRVAVGPVLGVVSHTFEQIEQETRCDPFFGCRTGDYLTSRSYLQSLNIGGLVRGRSNGMFGTIGAGLGSVSLDSSLGRSSALAPYLEAGAGYARGAGLFRALEAGLRLQVAETDDARANLGGAFLRLHLAQGTSH